MGPGAVGVQPPLPAHPDRRHPLDAAAEPAPALRDVALLPAGVDGRRGLDRLLARQPEGTAGRAGRVALPDLLAAGADPPPPAPPPADLGRRPTAGPRARGPRREA